MQRSSTFNDIVSVWFEFEHAERSEVEKSDQVTYALWKQSR
jgi:hypothetical protein